MTPLFINTRPKHKADMNLVIHSVGLPLLAIRHFDELEQSEMQDLVGFVHGKFDTLIVVSVEAVACAVRFLKEQGIDHACDLPHHDTLTVIAVGQPTADALAEFGFSVLTPFDAGCPMSNEGMLAMPVISELHTGDDVLIWRGVGGRRLLSDTLIKRGVNVRAIAFYERCVPSELASDFTRLLGDSTDDSPDGTFNSSQNHQHQIGKHSPIFVLISSQMSLNAWQSVYDQQIHSHRTHTHGLLPQNVIYLTLGHRLTALTATHYPHSRVYPVVDLAESTLNQAIQDVMVTYPS